MKVIGDDGSKHVKDTTLTNKLKKYNDNSYSRKYNANNNSNRNNKYGRLYQ